jgi:hypothetical protein
VRAREYVEVKVRPGHKSVRVAEGFLDSRVGNLAVYKLFLAPGANKHPLGHDYLPRPFTGMMPGREERRQRFHRKLLSSRRTGK